ncbi:hypothetical protein GCM10020331_014700 [Ectobacillus funiculus]
MQMENVRVEQYVFASSMNFPNPVLIKHIFKLLFRTIFFEQLGFYALSIEKRNEATFILLNYRETKKIRSSV